MDRTLYSNSWYRVANLKPFIRRHAAIHRHTYRGTVWYVLQDNSTGRFHRFSEGAYFVIGLMDGKRTLQEIWESACEKLERNMPTQDEVITLLSQLHQIDVLQADIPPDIENLHNRHVKDQRSKVVNTLRSPLAVRFPLLDPDNFLEKTKGLVAPLISWPAVTVWFITILSALVLAIIHWNELTADITDSILSLENIAALWLIYPAVKTLHEFGHAYAVKQWGGEVHEMGIMLLVFMPIPYVDASAAYAFREKSRRIFVGAAGIVIELLIASLAMMLWLNVEPGLVKSVAYNTMIVAGISTIFFNGNPLLRFDGYYILADLLEIPNLWMRSNQYLGYLVQRYVIRNKEAIFAHSGRGEAVWLVVYGLASFAYRIFITLRIALFVAGKFFFIGVAIALWAIVGLILAPFCKVVRSIFTNQELYKKKGRILALTLTVTAIIVVVAAMIPCHSFTMAEGVLWPYTQAQLYAGADGVVKMIEVVQGTKVRADDVLIRCENSDLVCEVDILKARLREYQARHRQARVTDRTEEGILKDEIARIREELASARGRLNALTIRSPIDGVFILPMAEDIPGLFVKRGRALGYVIDYKKLTVRVVVPQDAVDRVRTNVRSIEARLAEDITGVIPSQLIREVPAASSDLPSIALSLEGGGSIALDPAEKEKPQSFRKMFQFEIRLLEDAGKRIGERVYVRFEHDPEPLVQRWYRSLRRLFLKRFDV